jgi:hypothetical protein
MRQDADFSSFRCAARAISPSPWMIGSSLGRRLPPATASKPSAESLFEPLMAGYAAEGARP